MMTMDEVIKAKETNRPIRHTDNDMLACEYFLIDKIDHEFDQGGEDWGVALMIKDFDYEDIDPHCWYLYELFLDDDVLDKAQMLIKLKGEGL